MKKRLFVTNAYLVVILLLVLISNYRLEAQLTGDLRREILVYIQPHSLAFPSLERGSIGIENLPQISMPLRETFTRFGVQEMAKAFPNFTDADTLKTREDGAVVRLPQFSHIFKIYVANVSDIDSAVSALAKIPGVLYAHKNSDARRNSDPTYGNQWHLKNTGQSGGTIGEDIKAEEAWQIFTGSSSVKIAIIDGGVETGHDELIGKATGDLPDPYDGLGYHGTHVAAIAAGKANNGYGGRGVDWNAQILSEQIFNGLGYMGDGRAAQAITEAVNDGAHVINHSWGGPGNLTLLLALSYAYKMNRISVAAMGNTGDDYTQNPAAFPAGVIAVGGTQDNGTRDPGASYGNHIDVVAPSGLQNSINDAHDIWSAKLNDSFGYAAGTSMAAPMVSGIATLLKGYNPSLYNDDIENIIKLSADDKGPTGWDPEYGYGRVNAKKALERLGANSSGYVLNHATSLGGAVHSVSNQYQMIIWGAQAYGLADGNYIVKRREVRKNVTFSYLNSPAAWGRGVVTDGWADEGNVNFGYGYCEVVPGTVTSTGATLRTYVYEVWTMVGQYLGYKPTTPSNVQFAYTVHGQTPPSLAVTISGPSTVYHADPKGTAPNCYTWTANVTGGASPYSYVWSSNASGINPSYSECFSWNGYGGGTHQLTYRVDVTDSQNSTTFATKTVTAYNSGGGAEPRIVEAPELIPESFGLAQNYPNPFNPETEISYALPEPSTVRISVFDVLGREIAILEDRELSAGFKSLKWNGTSKDGSHVGSGVYILRMTAIGEYGKNFVETRKMLMTK